MELSLSSRVSNGVFALIFLMVIGSQDYYSYIIIITILGDC